MLLDKIATYFNKTEFEPLNKRLETALFTDSPYYQVDKEEVVQVILELILQAYKKGRSDEAYHFGGPRINLYQEED